MRREYPLLTAVILNYNNGDFIYQTIDSVLSQDYPNIELIISDDHSSAGFDADRIIDYVNMRRKDNFVKILINENKKNLGTTKHLDIIRRKSSGEFEIVIAADDIWVDHRVFSDFIDKFESIDPDAEWVISQIEMCDYTLKQVISEFVPQAAIDMVNRKAYKELLNLEATTCALPGPGSCFRRSFFDHMKDIPEKYYIVEDYTAHIRALRLGIPVYFLDRVTLKHRDGGISHGNARNDKILYSKYVHDLFYVLEQEILPYKDQFSDEAFKTAIARYDYHKNKHESLIREIEIENEGSPQKDFLTLRKKFKNVLDKGLRQYLIDCSRIAEMRRVLLYGIVFLLLSFIINASGISFYGGETLRNVLMILASFEILVFFVKLLINMMIKIYKYLKLIRRALRGEL